MSDQNPKPPVPGIEILEAIVFKRGDLLTMPAGTKASAFEPLSPLTTYTEFATEGGPFIRFAKPKDPPAGDGDQQPAGGE